MTDELRARLSRGRTFAVLAYAVPPALGLTMVLLLVMASQGRAEVAHRISVAYAGWPGIILAAAVVGALFRADAPHNWPGGAGAFGAFAGFFTGMTAAAYVRDLPLPVVGLLMLVGTVAGFYLGWLPGRYARAVVLQPFSTDLADLPIEVPFPARGERSTVLRVGTIEIAVLGGRFPLEDVSWVGPHRIAIEGKQEFPGKEAKSVRLTPGAAVRFTTPTGDWVFPTDQDEEAVEVIQRRVDAARPLLDDEASA